MNLFPHSISWQQGNMQFSLIPHPDTPSRAVDQILAEVARTELGDFVLHYCAVGRPEMLKWHPGNEVTARRDNLWRETCFECFVRPGNGPGYAEFNFALSVAWAAYWLSDYRADLQNLDIPLCGFDLETSETQVDLYVTLDANECQNLPQSSDWHLNLSAVIEEKDGTKSYWALAHPAEGPPDFHAGDCFVLPLAAPGQP